MPVDEKIITTKTKQKQDNRKKFKVVIILFLILMIVTGIINTALKYTGYKGLLRKVMIAYENYDIDELVSLSSDAYYYAGDDYVDDYFMSKVGETLDSFEESIGHNYKFSYKVNELYTVSGYKQKELFQTIESAYPEYNTKEIKKIVVSNITVTAQQGARKSEKNVGITMLKEKDTWRLLYIE